MTKHENEKSVYLKRHLTKQIMVALSHVLYDELNCSLEVLTGEIHDWFGEVH